MIKFNKHIFGIAVCALATAFMFAPTDGNSNGKQTKSKVIHNGQTLCLPAPAAEAHMREHNKGNFDCEVTGQPCGEDEPIITIIQ